MKKIYKMKRYFSLHIVGPSLISQWTRAAVLCNPLKWMGASHLWLPIKAPPLWFRNQVMFEQNLLNLQQLSFIKTETEGNVGNASC